jgi:hypothetical protein
MKYCLAAHTLYLRITKQTHLIELTPHPDKVIIKQLVEQTTSNIQQLLLRTCFYMTIVGIATRYRLDVRGSNPGGGLDCPHPSRPSLGPIQPPIQWVQSLFPGGKAVGAWC